MERLRELFGALGYTGVRTFIASGNVMFDAEQTDAQELEREVERCLREALGFDVTTFIRSPSEIAAVSRCAPFTSSELMRDGNMLYVGFLKTRPSAAVVRDVCSLGSVTDEINVHGRELYWLSRKNVGESPVSGALLERKLGGPMTLRNSTTVRKIAALLASSPGHGERRSGSYSSPSK